MGAFIDLTGIKFGRWNVLYLDKEKTKNTGRTYWVCECSCEDKTIRSVRQDVLKRNGSCGCLHREILSKTSKGNKYKKKYNNYDLSGDYGVGYTSKGEEFWFDLEDYDKIKDYCWNISPYGYVVCANNVNGIRTTSFIQRIILGDVGDYTKTQIDHISHNKRDNRKINLRICTPSQNSMNAKKRIDNTSGVTGVYFYGSRNKWIAVITVDGKVIHLGYFDTFEEAVEARKSAEEKYFGEYSYDNSINNIGVSLGGINDHRQ